MPEQLCNRPQIHPGHNKSTGKRMAVAMPGILLNLGLFDSGRKPSARPLKSIARAHGREDGVRSRLAFPALQLLESSQGDRVQRNGARIVTP